MKFLSHASLNTVRVVVGGDFTINVNDIPAIVNAVEIEGGVAAWGSSGEKTITLKGNFLATGDPQIVEADKLKISKLTVVDNTSDSTLQFKATLSDPLTPGTTLTFRVDKTNNETKKTVQGVPFEFHVPKPVEGTELSLGNVFANADGTVTVRGANFSDNTKVLLFSDATKASDPKKADIEVGNGKFKSKKSDEIVIDLCNLDNFAFDKIWTLRVEDGNQYPSQSQTLTPPAAAKNTCKPSGGSASSAQVQGAAKGKSGKPGAAPAKATPSPAPTPSPSGTGKKQKKMGL